MRFIQVTSVQDWSNELHNQEQYGEDLEEILRGKWDDLAAVYHGHASLVTPDGRQWWCPVGGAIGNAQAIDDSAAVLAPYLEEHKLLADHIGPRLPIMLFEAKTLNPGQAFCQDCNMWVNLSEDAETVAEEEV